MDRIRSTIPTMTVTCIGCGATMDVSTAAVVENERPPTDKGPLSITFNEVDIAHPVFHVTQYVCSEGCRASVEEALLG